MVKVPDASIQVPIKGIETAVLRPVGSARSTQMPFAYQVRLVTGALQIAWQSLPIQRQTFFGVPLYRAVDPMSGGKLACQQGSPRR